MVRHTGLIHQSVTGFRDADQYKHRADLVSPFFLSAGLWTVGGNCRKLKHWKNMQSPHRLPDLGIHIRIYSCRPIHIILYQSMIDYYSRIIPKI